MFRHIVFFKMQDFAEGNPGAVNARLVKEKLDELPRKIEVIREFEVGINTYKSERAVDVSIVSTFDSLDDMLVYQEHSAHLEVVQFIRKVRTESYSCDYEMQN